MTVTDVVEDVVQRLSVPDVIFTKSRQSLAVVGEFHLGEIITGRSNILVL